MDGLRNQYTKDINDLKLRKSLSFHPQNISSAEPASFLHAIAAVVSSDYHWIGAADHNIAPKSRTDSISEPSSPWKPRAIKKWFWTWPIYGWFMDDLWMIYILLDQFFTWWCSMAIVKKEALVARLQTTSPASAGWGMNNLPSSEGDGATSSLAQATGSWHLGQIL